jgi:hypothetical protein
LRTRREDIRALERIRRELTRDGGDIPLVLAVLGNGGLEDLVLGVLGTCWGEERRNKTKTYLPDTYEPSEQRYKRRRKGTYLL